VWRVLTGSAKTEQCAAVDRRPTYEPILLRLDRFSDLILFAASGSASDDDRVLRNMMEQQVSLFLDCVFGFRHLHQSIDGLLCVCQSQARVRQSIIVIASCVTRVCYFTRLDVVTRSAFTALSVVCFWLQVPNVAGLFRTCEIFNAAKLVIGDAKVLFPSLHSPKTRVLMWFGV
jgi:hypothetical protein